MFIILEDADADRQRMIRTEHIFELEQVDGYNVKVWLSLEEYGSCNSFHTTETLDGIMEKLGQKNN